MIIGTVTLGDDDGNVIGSKFIITISQNDVDAISEDNDPAAIAHYCGFLQGVFLGQLGDMPIIYVEGQDDEYAEATAGLREAGAMQKSVSDFKNPMAGGGLTDYLQ